MVRPWTVHPSPSMTRVCIWEDDASEVGEDRAVAARAMTVTRVLMNMFRLVVIIMRDLCAGYDV
jgi:hypothetical protein